MVIYMSGIAIKDAKNESQDFSNRKRARSAHLGQLTKLYNVLEKLLNILVIYEGYLRINDNGSISRNVSRLYLICYMCIPGEMFCAFIMARFHAMLICIWPLKRLWTRKVNFYLFLYGGSVSKTCRVDAKTVLSVIFED